MCSSDLSKAARNDPKSSSSWERLFEDTSNASEANSEHMREQSPAASSQMSRRHSYAAGIHIDSSEPSKSGFGDELVLPQQPDGDTGMCSETESDAFRWLSEPDLDSV